MTQDLQIIIDQAWEARATLNASNAPEVREAVEHVIAELDSGRLRVAERQSVGQWLVHQWVKKAVLLSFRLNDNRVMGSGDMSFYDKVPSKYAGLSLPELKRVKELEAENAKLKRMYAELALENTAIKDVLSRKL